MNIDLSIAFTLLALVAGMYLLAKTKSESLGKFFKFISWLVILVAGISLLCQLGRGACRMACHHGICAPSESCMPGMMMEKHVYMNGMKGDCAMHSGCREMEECCSGKHCEDMKGAHGKCCDEMEGGEKGCSHDMKKGCMMEEKKDSVKTK